MELKGEFWLVNTITLIVEGGAVPCHSLVGNQAKVRDKGIRNVTQLNFGNNRDIVLS